MENDRGLMVVEPEPLSVAEVKAQVNRIQQIMRSVMKKDEHYGVIPGCGDKPALFKPGAEKLSLTFRMIPDPRVEKTDLGDGHREYDVSVILTSPTGAVLGTGVGSACTLESKWRYRWDSTGKPVPKEYWKARDSELLGGSSFTARKTKDGGWMIYQRIEHDNPADYYNTCKKMAKKRALVDAVLTATAASDIFTQDIDDEDRQDDVVETTAKVAGKPSVKMPEETKAKPAKAPAPEEKKANKEPEAPEAGNKATPGQVRTINIQLRKSGIEDGKFREYLFGLRVPVSTKEDRPSTKDIPSERVNGVLEWIRKNTPEKHE